MDKGFDFPEVYELLEDYDYTIHVKEEKDGVELEGLIFILFTVNNN
jgi:hypothetical protein